MKAHRIKIVGTGAEVNFGKTNFFNLCTRCSKAEGGWIRQDGYLVVVAEFCFSSSNIKRTDNVRFSQCGKCSQE